MIPRPFGCDGDECDYEGAVWVHVDCGLAPNRGAQQIKHVSHVKTRAHLAANPLPAPQNRRSA